jgi:HK97 gp10 family phage protein
MAVSKLAEHTDDIVPRVLEAGGQVVLAKVRGNLQSSIGRGLKYKGRSTGELASALGLSPAKLDRDGNYNVKVGFREPRRDKGKASNAMLANILEHGKSGQPPKPFLKPAKTASKSECISVMKSKLEEEVSKL